MALAGAGFSQSAQLAPYGGLLQRASIITGFAWLTAVSARALKRTTDRPPAAVTAVGRMVTAVVTHDGACVGAVGPFPVDVPWWAEVEPVVTHLEQVLGVPAVVLRLLSVEGSDGARDGHVTYHAEALAPPPGDLAPATSPMTTTRYGCPGHGRRAFATCSAGRPGTSTSPGGPCSARRGTWRACSACRPPAARSGSRPSRLSPPPSRPRSPRSPRSTQAWCRPSWPAGRAACCSPTFPARSAGTRPRRSSRTRCGVSSPRRPASASRRPVSLTAAQRSWRRPSVTCSTARSAPS